MSDQDHFLNLPPVSIDEIERDAQRAIATANRFYRQYAQYSCKLAQELARVFGADTEDGIRAIDSSLCDITPLVHADDPRLGPAMYRLAANKHRLQAGESVYGNAQRVPAVWIVARVVRAVQSTCSLGNTITAIRWQLLSGNLAGRTYNVTGKQHIGEEPYRVCTGLRGPLGYRRPSQLIGMVAALRIGWWEPDYEFKSMTVAKWMRTRNIDLANVWYKNARSKAKKPKRPRSPKLGSQT